MESALRQSRVARRPFTTVDGAIRWAMENAPMRCRAIDPSAVYTRAGGHGMRASVERFTMILAAMSALDKPRWVALRMRAEGASYREIERALKIRNGSARRIVESAREEVRARLIEFELMDG